MINEVVLIVTLKNTKTFIDKKFKNKQLKTKK